MTMIWDYKMNMDQKQRRLIVAMKRVIEERFHLSEWSELATLTDGEDIIYEHHRLLTSLFNNN